MAQILIIEDDVLLRQALCRGLSIAGHVPTPTPDGQLGLEDLVQNQPDLVLLDLVLQEDVLNGLEILDRIRELHPDMPVIIMTGYGTIESAVEAMKRGANDFIQKPFNINEIVVVIERVLEVADLRNEIKYWRQVHYESVGTRPLLAHTPAMRQVLDAAYNVSQDRSVAVLICGEKGTGKDALAEFIHSQGDRRDRPFLEVDCSQLQNGEVEDVLFGIAGDKYNAGRPGKCELANEGTLILSEVGALCRLGQERLLRFLKDRAVLRRGAQRAIPVDVRIIATSSSDLAPEDDGGHIISDLFFRLSQISLFLPPLRDRPEDVFPLFKAFVREFSDAAEVEFGDGVAGMLSEYLWPGNVRELRNVAERAHLVCEGICIERAHLDVSFNGRDGGGLKNIVDGIEPGGVFDGVMRELLEEALLRSGGRQAEACRWLGLNRSRFSYRLKQYGIDPQNFV